VKRSTATCALAVTCSILMPCHRSRSSAGDMRGDSASAFGISQPSGITSDRVAANTP
jgi:hypothetical protein